jgi:hypothetical protein
VKFISFLVIFAGKNIIMPLVGPPQSDTKPNQQDLYTHLVILQPLKWVRNVRVVTSKQGLFFNEGNYLAESTLQK